MNYVLYRNLSVKSMAIIKVNGRSPESLQTFCAGLLHILWLVPKLSCPIGLDRVGKLGGQKDLDRQYFVLPIQRM